MDLNLKNKTALVFGGSKGLGRGSADALAAEGVDVALIARDPVALITAAGEIAQKFGVKAFGFAADVADHDAVLAAIDKAEAALGGHIDILINNTGGPPPSGVSGLDPALWTAQFNAMVLSVIRITDRLTPSMRQRKWGRILTIASSVVIEPVAHLGVSASLRSALVGWSKTLASDLASDGITVNMLLPGLIDTNRSRSLDASTASKTGASLEEVQAQRAASIPARRYGTSEEFGAVAAFLASDKAAYITGSMLRIDGGALRSV